MSWQDLFGTVEVHCAQYKYVDLVQFHMFSSVKFSYFIHY